ncbi:GvpL/GvpF family gas vesicle protein [Streptacidiphilus neutrinimicus]|uniref:GvpL/GvpF family gas vesicle protein n=1 Tax=Streptacidiphilus neutrinimicus TaxID=105420 RepID=UPI0005AA5F95|nr:GvpL/GvpF family gas vesicle protein [Streptacidiphilus neutrinimicus]
MGSGTQSACYVYGVVPADTTTPEGLTGLGDPPAPVTLLPEGGIAAVVSEIPADGPLGNAHDLRSHAHVLDTLAATGTPVLPFRFGAVLADAQAVGTDLLTPAEEKFRGALEELDGWVQFTVRGSYSEERLLRDVLAARPDIADLREATRGMPEEAERHQLIRLGEMVADAVAAARSQDSQELVERLGPHAGASRRAESTTGDEAVHTSFLVRIDERLGFEQAAEELALRWADRIRLRLLGPLAPYDFAVAAVQDGGAGDEAA